MAHYIDAEPNAFEAIGPADEPYVPDEASAGTAGYLGRANGLQGMSPIQEAELRAKIEVQMQDHRAQVQENLRRETRRYALDLAIRAVPSPFGSPFEAEPIVKTACAFAAFLDGKASAEGQADDAA